VQILFKPILLSIAESWKQFVAVLEREHLDLELMETRKNVDGEMAQILAIALSEPWETQLQLVQERGPQRRSLTAVKSPLSDNQGESRPSTPQSQLKFPLFENQGESRPSTPQSELKSPLSENHGESRPSTPQSQVTSQVSWPHAETSQATPESADHSPPPKDTMRSLPAPKRESVSSGHASLPAPKKETR